MGRRRYRDEEDRAEERAAAWRHAGLTLAVLFLAGLLLALAAGGLYVWHLASQPAPGEPPPRLIDR